MEPELPKGGIKSEPTSSPEAGGGPEMSYELPHSPHPVQLWISLESGTHDSHISCGLEGDPIPR